MWQKSQLFGEDDLRPLFDIVDGDESKLTTEGNRELTVQVSNFKELKLQKFNFIRSFRLVALPMLKSPTIKTTLMLKR